MTTRQAGKPARDARKIEAPERRRPRRPDPPQQSWEPIPLHVARWSPHAGIASVAFVEVTPGRSDPDASLRDEFGTRVPFDYVWFTPRVDVEDPCAAFRQQLERLHGGHPTAP